MFLPWKTQPTTVTKILQTVEKLLRNDNFPWRGYWQGSHLKILTRSRLQNKTKLTIAAKHEISISEWMNFWKPFNRLLAPLPLILHNFLCRFLALSIGPHSETKILQIHPNPKFPKYHIFLGFPKVDWEIHQYWSKGGTGKAEQPALVSPFAGCHLKNSFLRLR